MTGLEFRSFELPEPDNLVRLMMADGAPIYLRRYGNAQGPRIVVSHGNGLATDFYYPFWHLLRSHCEVILYDFRNHGRNELQDNGNHGFPFFVWDNEIIYSAIQQHFGAKPTLGAFHSMSAITAQLQSLNIGKRWDGLVLFDPPITPPPGHRLERLALDNHLMMAARAEKRQAHFPDYATLISRLTTAPHFTRLSHEAIARFAYATFRAAVDDGITLRCPAALEAFVFRSNIDSTVDARMADFPVPLLFIGADPDLPEAEAPSQTCRALAARWGVDYVAIPDSTHFLQIEYPEACIAAMMRFFHKHGFVSDAVLAALSR